MDLANVAKLLTQNAAVLREDLALMEAGTIKLTVFGADVTHDQAARLRGNLGRLETALAEFEKFSK